MTKAKAGTVASALTNADLLVVTHKLADNDYVIEARTPDGSHINVDVVKSFADAQSVTATVAIARLH